MSERVQVATKKSEANRETKASKMQKTVPSQSISSPVDQILFLQRTIGNQAVGKLLKSGAFQAKLRIGQPGDIYEQEADRVAEQVMRMPEPQVSNETKVSNPAGNNSIQRKCPGCKKGTKIEKEEEEEKLQKKEASGSTPEVTPELESRFSAVRGGGQHLPQSVRNFYEPRFDADFSGVRVHTDAYAAETAKSINARAFTVGNNIAFGAGQFAPESHEGRKLLAHELTHTIQQGATNISPSASTLNCPAEDRFITEQNQCSTSSVAHTKKIKGYDPILLGLNAQAFVQAQFVNEPNGGCGPCDEAAITGTRLHSIVQNAFKQVYGRRVISEGTFTLFEHQERIPASPTDSNGRLDLFQAIRVPDGIEIKIGEIKPNNAKGLAEGDKDLNWYKEQLDLIISDVIVQDFPINSNIRATVDFMSLAVPEVTLSYIERGRNCPPQRVIIGGGKKGLYLYSCEPPGSQINDCCDQDRRSQERTSQARKEKRYTFQMQGAKTPEVVNLSPQRALQYLMGKAETILHDVDLIIGMLEKLHKNREEHLADKIVGAAADLFGEALPDVEPWYELRNQLRASLNKIKAGEIEQPGKDPIETSIPRYISMKQQYLKFLGDTISTAETLGGIALATAIVCVIILTEGAALEEAPAASATTVRVATTGGPYRVAAELIAGEASPAATLAAEEAAAAEEEVLRQSLRQSVKR
jgi:hypothetical protein